MNPDPDTDPDPAFQVNPDPDSNVNIQHSKNEIYQLFSIFVGHLRIQGPQSGSTALLTREKWKSE